MPVMTKIREAASITEAKPGRMLIQLITPGQGSSGYYSPEVLEAAARDKVFPRGTQMHINHDSDVENAERPEGDLRDLAAVLDEDAYVDPSTGALVAEALVSSAWKTFLSEFKEHIGVSIVAEADFGHAEDGSRVVEKLKPFLLNRVDFVTVAGRGGSILKVMESARSIVERSAATAAQEAFTEDKRALLFEALRAAADDSYVWLADYDDNFVIYESNGSDRLTRRSYTLDGTSVSLGDDIADVRRRVEYDPINLPSETAGAVENARHSEEENVAKIEIDEAELTQLRESASRLEALEAEAAERTEREAAAAREARVEEANKVVREAFGTDETPKLYARVVESAAAAEDFDLEAFRTEVSEAAALREVSEGAGQPRGLGFQGDPSKATESASQIDDARIVNALHGKA